MTLAKQQIAIAEFCGKQIDTNDLNALHYAESLLTDRQQDEYVYQLSDIVAPITGEEWNKIHANPAQRREAFLRTIGRWEQS